MASPRSQVRVEGLSELLEALKQLPADLGSKGGGPIRYALFQATKAIRDDARARAPVDTGKLRENIIAFRDPNPRSRGLTEAYYITWRKGRRGRRGGRRDQTTANSERDAYYGKFVEFGTEKMPARPFLRPAFEAGKHEGVATFKEILAKAITRAAQKHARRVKRGAP